MIVNYTCKACGKTQVKSFESNAPFSIKCDSCGENTKRSFGNVSTVAEDPVVSSAKQLMLYGALPSGKDKKLI